MGCWLLFFFYQFQQMFLFSNWTLLDSLHWNELTKVTLTINYMVWLKRMDWVNLNSLSYFASSQFSPCQKVTLDKKVFSAGSASSFPRREICECYETVDYLFIYPLPFFSVFYRSGKKSSTRPSNHHHNNQASSNIAPLVTTSKNIK